MTGPILVTGATGTVGSHVVAELADGERPVRAAVRDPEQVPDDRPGFEQPIAFDFTKPETWGPALSDIEAIFLVRPPAVDRTTIASFIEAADRVGVARIAYLSTLGAEKNPLVPHHWIEKTITGTEMAYTLLRASFFMQNLLEVHREDIVERNELFVPAGRGRTSFIDARDIAAVAAIALTEPGHAGRAYDLTGPEALDYHAVAETFSDVLDRPVSYPEPSLVAFASRRYRRGEPLGFVALMGGIYTTARLGFAARVSEDSRRLLGHPPRGLRAFVEDHADAFGQPPDAPSASPT